jgi:hypothetical protein
VDPALTGEALAALSCEARFGLSVGELLALPSLGEEGAWAGAGGGPPPPPLSAHATLALFVLPEAVAAGEQGEGEGASKLRRTRRAGAGQRGWRQKQEEAAAAARAAASGPVVTCPGFRLLPPEEVMPLTAADDPALRHRRSERIAEAYTDDEDEMGDASTGAGSSLYV